MLSYIWIHIHNSVHAYIQYIHTTVPQKNVTRNEHQTYYVQTHFEMEKGFLGLDNASILAELKMSAGIRVSSSLHSNVFFITSIKARSPSKTHEIQIRQPSRLSHIIPPKASVDFHRKTTPRLFDTFTSVPCFLC